MASIDPIPDGLHSLTPQLTVDGAEEAMALYKKAFGAEERTRALDPSGKKIWHAELRIGSSSFFINDVFPGMGVGAHPTELWLYSEKADELFARAAAAGFTTVMPMSDMFWGDRTGTLQDRWGNRWTVARRVKVLTPEQLKKAQDDFVKSRPKG